MDNATKRPWIADPDDREGYEWNIHILQADDTNIRVCFMSNGPASEANAALIVTAVNQHAALLRCAEALREVRALIAAGAMTGFNCHDGDWAEKLFHSQQETSASLSALEQSNE